jgi:hypothetical protein
VISTEFSAAIASMPRTRAGSAGSGTPTSSSSSDPSFSNAGNAARRAAANASPSCWSAVVKTSRTRQDRHASAMAVISASAAAPGASERAISSASAVRSKPIPV